MSETAATASSTLRATGGLGRRAAWVLADQAVSSVANAALTIVVARAVGEESYGAFALAFSLYTFVVAGTQAVCGQVVAIRYSAVDAREARAGARGACGLSLVAGGASAAALLLAVPFTSVSVFPALLALAVLLPSLMLQDTWRLVFVSQGAPARAFVNGAVWTVSQFAVIGVLLVLDVDTSVPYLLAWGAAATLAAAYGVRQAGFAPSLRTALSWWRRHRDISTPSLANAVAILGATQLAFVLLASVGSVGVVGALRGAQTLLGPLNIVGFALTAFAIPEIVRRSLSTRGNVAVALMLSGTLVVVDLVWGGLLLLVPPDVGEQLLGATWAGAREALPALVLFTAAIGATTGATAVMRALARPQYAMWTSVLLGPLIVALSLAGLVLDGVAGASWGFFWAAAVTIGPCWFWLVRAARRGPR